MAGEGREAPAAASAHCKGQESVAARTDFSRLYVLKDDWIFLAAHSSTSGSRYGSGGHTVRQVAGGRWQVAGDRGQVTGDR